MEIMQKSGNYNALARFNTAQYKENIGINI